MRTQTIIGRREALRLGGGALLAGVAAPSMGWASTLGAVEPRRAILHNLHTGDTFNDVYFEGGRYVPQALAEAMRVLRDWRTGEEHVMEPGLFDALHAISTKLDNRQPFQIISGYRSAKTNAALHAKSSGVASNSQHTLGKAVDVRLQGVDLRNLHKAALATAAGGVGFYPKSDFVHVDVGRVRQWVGV